MFVTPAVFHFTHLKYPLVFMARGCGDFFLALEAWAGEPGVVLEALTLPGGTLQPRYPFRFSTATHGCGASPVFCLYSYQCQGGLFFMSSVVGLLFSQTSGDSQ